MLRLLCLVVLRWLGWLWLLVWLGLVVVVNLVRFCVGFAALTLFGCDDWVVFVWFGVVFVGCACAFGCVWFGASLAVRALFRCVDVVLCWRWFCLV